MKFIKNTLMVLGILLQVGTSFAAGPTLEDILASKIFKMRVGPQVEIAAKGSLEDKLISAVKNGDLKNVESLIAKGAGLEAGDRDDYDNKNALMIAVITGYTDIASKIINAGAHVNAETRYGTTVLTYAVYHGHTEIVKLLAARGAAKNQWNFGDLFEYAVAKGNNEMVKALMVEGARIDHDTLSRAYSWARTRCSAEIVNAIKELQSKNHS